LFTYSFVLFKGEKGLQRYEKKRILPRLFLSLGQSPGDKVDFLPLRECFFCDGQRILFCVSFLSIFLWQVARLISQKYAYLCAAFGFSARGHILCGMLHNILRDITRPILSQNQ